MPTLKKVTRDLVPFLLGSLITIVVIAPPETVGKAVLILAISSMAGAAISLITIDLARRLRK